MTFRRAAALLCLLAGSVPVKAAELAIGAGSSVSLGGSALDLGCADLQIEGSFAAGAGSLSQAGDVTIAAPGTLAGGSGTLELTGDWTRAGTFQPGSSRVRFVDGCGSASSTITGSSSFADLELATSSAKTFAFQSGATTSVSGEFAVSGAAGNLARIRATLQGNAALLDLEPGSTQAISYADVQDNHAVGEPVVLDSTSMLSGNAAGWGFAAVIPALGWLGALALAALLVSTGALRRATAQSD